MNPTLQSVPDSSAKYITNLKKKKEITGMRSNEMKKHSSLDKKKIKKMMRVDANWMTELHTCI